MRGELCETVNKIASDLERLRTDFNDAAVAWSYCEALNGYPTAATRTVTHRLLNRTTECIFANNYKTMMANSAILAIARMMDVNGRANDSNRQSLLRVAYSLKQENVFEKLAQTSSNGTLVALTNVSVSDTLKYKQMFERWTDHKSSASRCIGTMKPKFKALRDEWLAHSLENALPSEVDGYLIRDALILCGAAIKTASLGVVGINWNPKFVWRYNLKIANHFWDTHTIGLSSVIKSKGDHHT